tara:strand:- start:159 stop:329 length:171 start_codon:yes stop_codon:yes gene_type:complete
MTEFIITDKLENRQVELTFEQYYDLQIGLKCAADVYSKAGISKRVNEFESLLNLIN